MNWVKRINDAIDLIERKVTESINMEEISRVAYSFPYHFQRMFYMLTGMTVAEYSRKRKLTLAAHELASSSAKVIDVAIKYGYDSPESFSKAFQKIHGIAPSKVKHSGIRLKAFPRISLQFSLKGNQEVEYQIEEKEAFTVVGKTAQLTCQSDSRLQFWRECRQDATLAKLDQYIMNESFLGVTMNFAQESFQYTIGKRGSIDLVDEGLSMISIPAATWAIFTANGPLPNAIQSVFVQIYQEWFPATGYEHSGAPEIEVYLPGNSATEDYRCEVWIPVVRHSH